MSRKLPQIIENKNEEPIRVPKSASDEYTLHEGGTAIIEVKDGTYDEFRERYDKLECWIVSCHRDWAIVETCFEEMIVCEIKNLRPIDLCE